ncbi:MAG TPA: class I SAM-dependent methyltransferase [Pedococcus sp.]|uniref:class I SAM-dependent methyltransferase n=1 Tax=Pedococcus sp. TaxID=2860345 RepID=UPI002F93B36A
MRTEQIAKYWDEYAAEYDLEPDHGLLDSDTRMAWKDLLRMWLPHQASDVADLACGTGTLTALAAELGHRVHGFDLSGQMVERARAKTAHFGAAVCIEQADVSNAPLADSSVDAVLARHILWTLPDPQAALAGWARALRPGGRLVLVEGRWTGVGDDSVDDPEAMPWSGGVAASDLRAAVERVAENVQVVPLTDPVLWGREIDDERYLLTATVPARGRP